MIITCNRHALTEALSIVARGVATKAVMPALEGILLQAAKDTLTLTAYNLEIGIVTTIPCDLKEEGALILNAKILLDIVRRTNGETVSIETGEKHLTYLTSGSANFTILASPAEDFPQLPDVSVTESLELEAASLKTAITQTGFAISISEDNPVHTGALFDLKPNTLTVVAVDGFRLALNQQQTNVDLETSFIVPRVTLLELTKILNDQTEKVTLSIGKRHILFQIDEYRIVSRLLEGEFLDYHSAIPKSNGTTVTVNSRSLIESVERMSLLISEKIVTPVRMKFEEDNLYISCNTTLGKAKDQLSITMEGPGMEMGFNHRYLLDALRASGSDQVKLELSGALSPMKMRPTQGEDFLFLVLPVRLKAE